jgi:hypothetical protein
MKTINEADLKKWFGATAAEMGQLRRLLTPDSRGQFDTAAACRALLQLRRATRSAAAGSSYRRENGR